MHQQQQHRQQQQQQLYITAEAIITAHEHTGMAWLEHFAMFHLVAIFGADYGKLIDRDGVRSAKLHLLKLRIDIEWRVLFHLWKPSILTNCFNLFD